MFLLAKLVGYLLQPSHLIYLALLLGGALVWSRRGFRVGRWLLSAGLVASLLPAWLPLTAWLAVPLEERFAPPLELPPQPGGIIVLGGAEELDLSAAHPQAALNDAAERLVAFAALARRYPEARLVYSGGSTALKGGGPTGAAVAREVLSALGVPPERTVFEDAARNTYENAVLSKALVRPRPGEPWLLVTSAMHMPRAVGVFRKVGWPVVPYPVDYQLLGPSDLTLDLWPSPNVLEELARFDDAAHEWLGLIAYRLLGRTDRLLPAP